MKQVATLYHFTCEHGHRDIETSGFLKPFPHPFMPGVGPLLWLTDLAEPTPDSVGLTSAYITCNRLKYRYIVRCKAVTHWFDIRERAPKWLVADMESFGQPEHWWVARRPVLASEFSFDTGYKQQAAVEEVG